MAAVSWQEVKIFARARTRPQIQLKERWDDRRWDARLLAIGRDPDIALLTGEGGKDGRLLPYGSKPGCKSLASLCRAASRHRQAARPPAPTLLRATTGAVPSPAHCSQRLVVWLGHAHAVSLPRLS